MKFVADRAALLGPLQRCSRVAARRTTVPMFSHLRIEAHRRGVRLTANDTEREIVVELEAAVSKTGVTTAPALVLANFVASIADGSQIDAEQARDKDRLTLRAGTSKGTFPTLSADDFPSFREANLAATVELDGKAFAAALRSVAHAQSNEKTRYYLNGVYLHRRGDRELAFVATDGHRLARTTLEVPQDLPDLPGIIVPRQAVADIHALAEDADQIEIAIGETMLRVSAAPVVLTTKLIDGTFPDYERVIPPVTIAEGFETDRAALMTAAKRCDLVSEGKEHSMKMAPGDTALELMSGRSEDGEIADEIAAQTTTRIPIGINPRYLLPALEALGGSAVRIRYADSGAPIAFTDPSQPHKLQIIMAKRV